MDDRKPRGLIVYFAHNPVAANLLMMFVLIVGTVSFLFIQRQMFPNLEVNYINVQVQYPGASPQEIEESILIKIEESLKNVSGIKQAITNVYRGGGTIELEIDVDQKIEDVLDKVQQKSTRSLIFQLVWSRFKFINMNFSRMLFKLF